MLNIKSLSANELYQLATILNTCMKKSKEAQKNLSQVVDKVKSLSEDSFAFVWDKIPAEHHSLSAITSPYVTALQEKSSIEKEFNDRKVRAVHYRKQAVKVIKEYDTGMMKVIAYCADHDFPVECYQIPRCFPHYNVLNQFYNQVGASKQLLKSKYFPSYLGFDDLSNEENNLYFFEIKKGKALEQLLMETGQILKDDQHLFKFWAKELLYAFKDITYRSTYTIEGDISLRNMYISDLGIKVYLKKLKFGELRDDTIKFHLSIEAKMLKNYANILIQMQGNQYNNALQGNTDDILASMDIDPELKAILYECLHAVDKIQQSEQESYDHEINEFILQEKISRTKLEQKELKNDDNPDAEFSELMGFKKAVQNQEEQEAIS